MDDNVTRIHPGCDVDDVESDPAATTAEYWAQVQALRAELADLRHAG